MNKIISKGNGKQMRRDRGKKGFEIIVNDSDQAEVEFENLYRFLEKRYGYSKEKAKDEVNRRIRR